MNRLTTAIFIAVLVLTATSNATADWRQCVCPSSTYDIKWSNPSVTVELDAIFQDYPALANRLLEAIDAWNALPGSNLNFNVISDPNPDGMVRTDDQENEIAFAEKSPSPGVAARTIVTYPSCSSNCFPDLVDIDMVFFNTDADDTPFVWDVDAPTNFDTNWAIDENLPPGDPKVLNFQLFAAHELGHMAGLVHSDNGMSRMESNTPFGGWFHEDVDPAMRVTPLPRDAAELGFLYPSGTTPPADLYAINFQHAPSPASLPGCLDDVGNPAPHDCFPNSKRLSWKDGDLFYFPHNLTALRYGAFPGSQGEEPWFRTLAGDQVEIRICQGNLGAEYLEDVPIDVYLSVDDTIDSSDSEVNDGWYFPAGAFNAFHQGCADITITVPDPMPTGVYYIIYAINGYPYTNSDPNNVHVLNKPLTVEAPGCGDGVCDTALGETWDSCPNSSNPPGYDNCPGGPPAPPLPCNDGVQNAGEDGVDCGGGCPNPCASIYEAETMYHSTGGSTPEGWNIWANGYISDLHAFDGGDTSITVIAKGEPAFGIWPHMVVSVGEATVGAIYVNSSEWTPYTFNFIPTTGLHVIKVSFDNDYYLPPYHDRNLLVDKVIVDEVEPPSAGGLDADLPLSTDWGTGYCATLEVTNTGATPTNSWSVTFDSHQSVLYNYWNGNFSDTSGQVTVTPLSWNSVISPGETNTSVGICANRIGNNNDVATVVNATGFF